MPNMNEQRIGPGCFLSQDEQFLYALGGECNSLERIKVDKNKEW